MYRLARVTIVVLLAISGILFLGVFASNPAVVSAQGEVTTTPAHTVWFHEDFSTRANRWRLLDLGKAVVAYDQSTLSLRAQPADYALWSIPDTDLKLDHYDIQVEGKLIEGGADARVGVIIGYRSESDMLVVAVTAAGNVYVGRYYFGVWNDIVPPTKVKLDPEQPITVRAIVDEAHMLKLMVNDQPAGQAALKNYRAGSFGLFALSGKEGGVNVAFSRFVVSDLR